METSRIRLFLFNHCPALNRAGALSLIMEDFKDMYFKSKDLTFIYHAFTGENDDILVDGFHSTMGALKRQLFSDVLAFSTWREENEVEITNYKQYDRIAKIYSESNDYV